MKRIILLTVVLVGLTSSLCKTQDYTNRLMNIRMNGHDNPVKDMLSDTINKLFKN